MKEYIEQEESMGLEKKKKKGSKQSSWKDSEEALMPLKPKTRV